MSNLMYHYKCLFPFPMGRFVTPFYRVLIMFYLCVNVILNVNSTVGGLFPALPK